MFVRQLWLIFLGLFWLSFPYIRGWKQFFFCFFFIFIFFLRPFVCYLPFGIFLLLPRSESFNNLFYTVSPFAATPTMACSFDEYYKHCCCCSLVWIHWIEDSSSFQWKIIIIMATHVLCALITSSHPPPPSTTHSLWMNVRVSVWNKI